MMHQLMSIPQRIKAIAEKLDEEDAMWLAGLISYISGLVEEKEKWAQTAQNIAWECDCESEAQKIYNEMVSRPSGDM